MEKLQEVELTIKLQQELEKMSDKEFQEYMKDKVLSYNGKLYGLQKSKKKKEVKQ